VSFSKDAFPSSSRKKVAGATEFISRFCSDRESTRPTSLSEILEGYRMQQESFGHAEHRASHDAETSAITQSQRCQAMLQQHADPKRTSCQIRSWRLLSSCMVRVALRELLVCDRRRGRDVLRSGCDHIGAHARFLCLFDDAAVEQVDGALGEVGVALVVVTMQIVAPLRCKSRSSSITASPFFGVQVFGGLVGPSGSAGRRPGAGHRDTLLLTALQL